MVLGHAGEHHSPAVVVASTPITRRKSPTCNASVTLCRPIITIWSHQCTSNSIICKTFSLHISKHKSIHLVIENLYLPVPDSHEGPLASEESSCQWAAEAPGTR